MPLVLTVLSNQNTKSILFYCFKISWESFSDIFSGKKALFTGEINLFPCGQKKTGTYYKKSIKWFVFANIRKKYDFIKQNNLEKINIIFFYYVSTTTKVYKAGETGLVFRGDQFIIIFLYVIFRNDC